jgi:plastocyanin
MMKITVLLACAAAFALAACGGSSYGGSSSSSSSAPKSSSGGSGGAYGGYGSGSSTAKSASSSSGSGSHAVELNDNSFTPATITGKAGSKVKLALANNGAAEHTFTIDSQHVDQTLPPGQHATVTVTIPSSGSVQFYCRFHKSLGMVGTIKPS